jgi:hypothetical protein
MLPGGPQSEIGRPSHYHSQKSNYTLQAMGRLLQEIFLCISSPLSTLESLKELVLGFEHRGTRIARSRHHRRHLEYVEMGITEILFQDSNLKTPLQEIETFTSFRSAAILDRSHMDEAVFLCEQGSVTALHWNNFTPACAIESLYDFPNAHKCCSGYCTPLSRARTTLRICQFQSSAVAGPERHSSPVTRSPKDQRRRCFRKETATDSLYRCSISTGQEQE